MKNKITKLLIFLVSIFIGINSVDADNLTFIKSTDNPNIDYTLHYIGNGAERYGVSGVNYYRSESEPAKPYSIVQYTISRKNTNSPFEYAYCLEPNLMGGVSDGDVNYIYQVDRISTDNIPKTGSVELYDIGVQTILQYGQNSYHTSVPNDLWDSRWGTNNLSRGDYYNATSIAIRAWTLGLFGWGNNNDQIHETHNYGMSSAIARLGYEFAEKADQEKLKVVADTISNNCVNAQNIAQCIKNNADSHYSSMNWYTGYDDKALKFSADYAEAQKVYNLSQKLFNLGLEAAYNYKINNGVINNSLINHSALNTIINNKTSAVYTIKFTTNDIPEGSVINQIKYECSNCERNGIRLAKVFANDTEITSNYQSVNLINYLDDKGEVVLKFEFSKEEVIDCSNAQVKFQWYQNIPGVNNWRMAVLKVKQSTLQNGENHQDYQRFVSIEKTSDETPTLTATINCQDLICDNQIEKPICVDEDANVPADEDNVAKITTDSRVKICVLDNYDDAGNSYQLSELNGGVANDYCNVFCKEDYANIQFNPIVNDVKCGRYFKLSARIEGTKDCYTGGTSSDKSINLDQFIIDIEKAQQDMVDAFNEYNRWLELSKVDPSENPNQYVKLTYVDYGDRPCYENECNPAEEDCENCTRKNEVYEETPVKGYQVTARNIKQYKITGYYVNGVAIYQDYYISSTEGYDLDGGFSSPSYNAPANEGNAQTLHNRIIDDKLKTADYHLKYTIDEYMTIIKNYNSCTTRWNNDFKFAQTIKYEYTDEGNYYGLLKDDYKYLVEDGNLETTEEMYVCTGEIDDTYKCKRSDEEVHYDNLHVNTNDYGYSGVYNDIFEQRKFLICDIDSVDCYPDSDAMVSIAKYVRKSVEKKQSYTTPNAFYQDSHMGRIDTNYDYNGPEIQHSNIPQGGLPVSKGTEGGGVFRLSIQDLGEFYDTGETGRLIDYRGDKEESSVAYALLDTYDFDGNYGCHYTSYCRHECPDCDFECEGDGDDHNCELTECPECTIVCINCLFNQNELQLTAKTISTTNFNGSSVNHKFGYNWLTTTSLASLQLLNDKARITIDQIVAANEQIYDENYDDNTVDGFSNLGFSIKLTPEIIRFILEHNEEIENKDIGGYADDSLTCYDYTYDGTTYNNILCFSDFLDELIDECEKDSNCEYKAPRRTEKNDRTERPNDQNYWVFYDGFKPEDIDSVIGGPAWR